ncbi:MAG: FKBP-type peptidyl-prolyl cis-trans isomerase [Gammaproteobacteria bacterium]
MPIENNHVVHFHYTLSEVGGATLESSLEADAEQPQPMACLIGYRNILESLEAEFLGKEEGDEFNVELAPEKAYGPVIADATQRIPIKHLINPGKGKLKPGMAVKVNTEKGPRDVRIIKVGKFNADVDTNHPLAGKTLNFAIKIVSVRDATAEEISHRHVHGDGGHHH